MECLWSGCVVLALLCGCLAATQMAEGANLLSSGTRQSATSGDSKVRLMRQADNNSTDDGSGSSGNGDWLGAHWYWLLVVLVALFVLILLACICCCYKQSHPRSDTGRIQLSSMKSTLPSPNLTGFTSPISTSVADREGYHGNLVVSPGILSADQTPVASPQMQFSSLLSQQQRQHSPRSSVGSIGSKYGRKRNQSPWNSSGSEETIRHATGTPSVSSLASVSSTHAGKISRAESFTGVGQQPRLSRRKSGSQVRVVSLSRGASSLSVMSAASNSSAHSGTSNQSVHSNGAYQSDSSQQRTYLAVDVQVHVNREMSQHEKNIYTAAVLAESAAKLAQSAASYGEEPIIPSRPHKMLKSHRLYYSTTAPLLGSRQNCSGSPGRRSSPSRSLPIPVSHSIHYSSSVVNRPNGCVLHEGEIPVASLDSCVRGEHCIDRRRSSTVSSNDSEDEMFHPKHSTSGISDITGPPLGSFHRLQANTSLEKERKARRSRVGTNGNTDEGKKKKRHSHQSVATQLPREPERFVGGESPEMPLHMRNPNLPVEQATLNTTQETSVNLLPAISSVTKDQQLLQHDLPSANDDNMEGEKTVKRKNSLSLEPSGQLKRAVSASTPLSSSLSSVTDELNQSYEQGLGNLKRQYSVPNILQSSSSITTHQIPRALSGTSLSASGYAPSGASTNTLDSVSAVSKPRDCSGHNNISYNYPLRRLLDGEHDHLGATDPHFSAHNHYISGTSSAALSEMAEKAPLSPALPFTSTNGYSMHISTYNNSNSYVGMYGDRPSLTGLAPAEV